MKNKIKITLSACLGCVVLMLGALNVSAAGALSIAVSSGTVKAGDTVTVTIYAKDANNTDVTADMNITYDTSKLEYVSSSASSATGGGGTVKASGSTIDIKFKAVGSGDAYVKAEGAAVTAAGTHINVSGSAASTDTSSGTVASTTTANTTDTTANAAKSGDNSLSSLKISQGTLSPEFKGSVTAYTAAVGSDVNEITVTPVTSNSKATVESITGNTNLTEGKNTIKVLVKAENGTEATYTITVTKSASAATASSQSTTTDTATSQTQTTTKDTESTTTDTTASGEAITIDGANYKISDDFADSDIPEGFSRADVEYKGIQHKGLIFDQGHLGMYYLVNDAGEGKFFVYDADRDGFYPYIRLTFGEHFIILMSVPNGAVPPESYEQTTLALSEGVTVSAYQYAGGEAAEIVKTETADGQENVSTGQSDFYVFYAMDDTGVAGWYQYDMTQGTYQRLNEEAAADKDESGQNYDTLLEDYNSLSDRYKSMKTKDRRIIVVTIFVMVVLVIIVINLLLKIRELGSDDYEDEEDITPVRRKDHKKKERYSREVREERPVRKARAGKTSRPVRSSRAEREEKPAGPVRPERPEKPVNRTTRDRLDDFYDDDDDEFMDTFEDEPSVLGRGRRKERPAGTYREETSKKEPVKQNVHRDDEDDDIELIDLNDL